MTENKPIGREPNGCRWDPRLNAWITIVGGQIQPPSPFKCKKKNDFKDYSRLLQFPDLVDINAVWAKDAVKTKYQVMCGEVHELETQNKLLVSQKEALQAELKEVKKNASLLKAHLRNTCSFTRNVFRQLQVTSQECRKLSDGAKCSISELCAKVDDIDGDETEDEDGTS